jgi:hypothetical protein
MFDFDHHKMGPLQSWFRGGQVEGAQSVNQNMFRSDWTSKQFQKVDAFKSKFVM